MKIIFFVSSMGGGGAERVASLLCNYWVTSGHEVLLVPTFSGRGECAYELEEKVRLLYLADLVKPGGKGLCNKIIRLAAIRSLIKSEMPCTVVSFISDVNVGVLLATALLKVPVIVSERSYPPMLPIPTYIRILRSNLYPTAKAVVMQTQQGFDWLKEESPGSNGVIIPNPISLPVSASGPMIPVGRFVDCRRPFILAVGRLSNEKQFKILVQSFHELSIEFEKWDLVILGEGPERGDIEQIISNLGLAGRVFMPGRVGNLSDWYNAASIFVMTSRYEGFPNALLEAMAHCLPVVANDCRTGPRDLIENGSNGVLIPEHEFRQILPKKLKGLINDPLLRKSLGLAASEVVQKYSIENVAKKWQSVIEVDGC